MKHYRVFSDEWWEALCARWIEPYMDKIEPILGIGFILWVTYMYLYIITGGFSI